MWIRYDSLCTNCDSLFQVTTSNALVNEPSCLCGNPKIVRVSREDVTYLTDYHLDFISRAHYN